MSGSFLTLLMLSLASFRLTRLLVYDKITGWLRKPFHEESIEVNDAGEEVTYLTIKGKGIQAFFGELLSCFWCTGVWCTAFLYICYSVYPVWGEPLAAILAIAGLAGILEAAVQRLIE
ncbi:DUF1360 domain-containing protein [Bacillus lacus]|uniref:DUF1360 domain-containing protein n=1 Tax=Metabacillus lacus TaxID=1983721 RepID=A0A7X2IYF6_9BACI|nr:DUF1360 domain-containing protein [Metabacillus lacus]MRX71919.1 DUF1360 domain-containing protein [Metabacillus lacus]